MQGKAAILYEPGGNLVIKDVEIAGPKAGEVLVKLVATSICHTDIALIRGDIPVPLPMVLGHEGVGTVEEVGPGVTSVGLGDPVLLYAGYACGQCRPCLTGRSFNCDQGFSLNFGGNMPDGTKRLRTEGQEIGHFFCQSSLAEYAVVPESIAIKVPEGLALDKIAPLACGASTGIGAVLNKARVQAGSSVAVFGCGGVGLSAIMAAKLVGAGKLIAIDVVNWKLDMARELGATQAINGSSENPVERIKETTGGGADYAFECIGKSETISQAFDCLGSVGTAIIIGAPSVGSKASLDVFSLLSGKTVTGCVQGNTIAPVDIPRYIELYARGLLPIDQLTKRVYSLDQINDAVLDMENNRVVKPLIRL